MMKMKPNSRFLRAHYVVAALMLVASLLQALPLLSVSSEGINEMGKAMQNMAYQNQTTLDWMRKKGITDIKVAEVESGVKRELWVEVAKHVVTVLVGAGAALMAFFLVRLWRIAVIAAAVLYLWPWYGLGPLAHVSWVEAYQLKWMLATTVGIVDRFIIEDIVLPATYLALIVFLVIQPLWSRKKTAP